MAQKLSLTTTSLHNVIISNQSDVIYYEVVTPKWEPGVTRISKMDPNSRELEVIAELQNESEKTTRTTAVRLRGEQFHPAHDFLKKEERQSAVNGNFRGKDGKHYEWRMRKGRLELTKQGDPDAKPVAVYRKPRRYLMVLRMSRSPVLEVEPSAMETLDSLIVSWLLVERNRRDGS